MEERKTIQYSDADIESVSYGFCTKSETDSPNIVFRMQDKETGKLRPYKIGKEYLYNKKGKQVRKTVSLDESAYKLTFLQSGDVIYEHIQDCVEPIEIVGFSVTGAPFDKYGNFYHLIKEFADFDFVGYLKSDEGGGTFKRLFAFAVDNIVYDFVTGYRALEYRKEDDGYPLDYIECVNDLLDHQITKSTTPMELIKEINYAYNRKKDKVGPNVPCNVHLPRQPLTLARAETPLIKEGYRELYKTPHDLYPGFAATLDTSDLQKISNTDTAKAENEIDHAIMSYIDNQNKLSYSEADANNTLEAYRIQLESELMTSNKPKDTMLILNVCTEVTNLHEGYTEKFRADNCVLLPDKKTMLTVKAYEAPNGPLPGSVSNNPKDKDEIVPEMKLTIKSCDMPGVYKVVSASYEKPIALISVDKASFEIRTGKDVDYAFTYIAENTSSKIKATNYKGNSLMQIYSTQAVEFVIDANENLIRDTRYLKVVSRNRCTFGRSMQIPEELLPVGVVSTEVSANSVDTLKSIQDTSALRTTEEAYRLQLEEELMTRIPSVCIQSSDCHGLALLRYALDFPELFEELKEEFKKY